MKYVYMLRAGERHYKIGITGDVLKRIKAIQTSNHNRIQIVMTKPVNAAETLEQRIHGWLKEYRADGGTEWFELSIEQALDLVIKITNVDVGLDVSDYLTMRELGLKQITLERRFNELLKKCDAILNPPKPEVIPKERNAQDAYFEEAERLVQASGKASASLLQRRLNIGYARAARLLDQLQEAGIVGGADGARPREILITK